MPAKQQSITLSSKDFKGLALSPSQLTRDFNTANLCSNVEKNAEGQITIRKGTRFAFMQNPDTQAYQILFPFTYVYHDTDTGATTEELLALGMSMNSSYVKQTPVLYRMTLGTVTISYSGAGNGTITMTPRDKVTSFPNVWDFVVKSNGVTDINADVPCANGSANTGTLNTLIGLIHALSTFNCSPSTLPTSAARAFPDVLGAGLSITIASGGSYDIDYYDIETIGNGLDAPLSFSDPYFILPSFQNYSNVVDIAYGNYLQKYDGHDFYRSGLPQASISSIADSGGGTAHALGNTYIYKIVYSRVDHRGNIIDGEDSDDTLSVATHTMVATRDIALTINNLRASAYPNFALKGARVNGLQTVVNTITVDAGHTLVVGDIVYFYDGVGPGYVTRTVTGIAATTITIDGMAVDVTDNLVISNNVRIQIWRTKNSGTDFYFVDEIPNDYNAATTVYTDAIADTSLTELYSTQIRKHSLPPKCHFVGEHQGLRVVAGDPDYPNRVTWALPDDPEGFPLESNNTDIKGGGLGALTGFGTVDDDTLAVFKETGHVLLDGSLDDLNVRILNRANTSVGCTSFRTLQNIGDDNKLVGLSLLGPFVFTTRSPKLLLSENIKPLFNQPQTPQVSGTTITDPDGNIYSISTARTSFTRVLRRATAINDYVNKKYHLYLPAEVWIPGQKKLIDPFSTKYLVYDYEPEHLFWTEYTFFKRYRLSTSGDQTQNMNPWAGFTIYKNNVWMGCTTSSFRSTGGAGISGVTGYLFHYVNNGTKYDYCDAAYPVYLDLHYTPITREQGAASSLFKPLFMMLYRFLKNNLNDPVVAQTFGDNFSIVLKSILNYKEYATSTFSTKAQRTFDTRNARTSLTVKCVTAKAKSYQIQVTNENADPANFEIPAFDEIEFIYSTPYDKQIKDTRRG